MRREGWKTSKLGEICEIYQPKTISRKQLKEDGEYPVFGANGIIGRYDHYNHEEPQVLITCRGATCGYVNVSLPKSWITGNAMVVRPMSQDLDLRYLEYFCRGAIDFSAVISGAAQPQITRKSLSPVIINYPPFQEQKRIVAILDEAFAGIEKAVANTEKNLANARELFESYLNSIFSDQSQDWTKKRLKDICVDYGRGKSKHRPRNDPKLYGGKYPFIQTGDVRNCDRIINRHTTTYNETGLAQSKLWTKGTICITIAANIAETGILGFAACFPDSIIGLVVDEYKADNSFVEFLLQSQKLGLQKKGKGSAQDNINLATFETEYFPLPDVKRQRQIAEILQELANASRQLESIYQQKLTALAELKQSLLQKAFSGELTANANNKLKEAAA